MIQLTVLVRPYFFLKNNLCIESLTREKHLKEAGKKYKAAIDFLRDDGVVHDRLIYIQRADPYNEFLEEESSLLSYARKQVGPQFHISPEYPEQNLNPTSERQRLGHFLEDKISHGICR